MGDSSKSLDRTQPLMSIVDSIVAQAARGEEIEAYSSRSTETDVRAHGGATESLSSAMSAGVGIRVISDGRQGFAYAGSLDPVVVGQALADARDNAQFAYPDDAVGLAEPDGISAVDLDLWSEELVSLPTSTKVEWALELEARVRASDSRIRQVSSADYGDMISEMAIATTNGIRATGRKTMCSLSVSAIAGEGADSHSGVGFSAARSPADLDLDRAAQDATLRAVRLIGASKAPSGVITVVFDPRVASTLISIVSSALSGEAVNKGRSLFAGRIGERVGIAALTLVDDPTDARSFGAAVVDAEGLSCRRNILLSDGVLQSFVYDSTSARKAGTKSTGCAVRGGYASTPTSGCRALSLTPGQLGQDEILAEIGEGLYVQSITGVHSGVNPVSGDFSVGAEGLLIRDGKLDRPVREVTIASTIQRMLKDVVAVGNDVEWLPGAAAGQTLAVQGLTMSGD